MNWSKVSQQSLCSCWVCPSCLEKWDERPQGKQCFCKNVSYPPQLGTDKFCKGLDLDCHRELEERPSPSPLLSSTPILSTDYGTLSLEIQGSFHRPHITIVEEAAGGFSNSLNAKISYTPLLENADFLIVSAADLNLY